MITIIKSWQDYKAKFNYNKDYYNWLQVAGHILKFIIMGNQSQLIIIVKAKFIIIKQLYFFLTFECFPIFFFHKKNN